MAEKPKPIIVDNKTVGKIRLEPRGDKAFVPVAALDNKIGESSAVRPVFQSIMGQIKDAVEKGDQRALVGLGFTEADASVFSTKKPEVIVSDAVEGTKKPSTQQPSGSRLKKAMETAPGAPPNLGGLPGQRAEGRETINETNPILAGMSPGVRIHAEKLAASNAKLPAAAEALKGLDIGVTRDDGLVRYDQNPGMKKDGEVSMREMSRLSDTSMSGTKWDDASRREHAATRERVKKALDLNGDGQVSKEEIQSAVQILKTQNVTFSVDAAALAETLNNGNIPTKAASASTQPKR